MPRLIYTILTLCFLLVGFSTTGAQPVVDLTLSHPPVAINVDSFYISLPYAKLIQGRGYKLVICNVDLPLNQPYLMPYFDGMIVLADILLAVRDSSNSAQVSTGNRNYRFLYGDSKYDLHDANGNKLIFFTRQFPYQNVSSIVPQGFADSSRYYLEHSRRIASVLAQQNNGADIFQGVFGDDFFRWWFGPSPVDFNRDRTPDSPYGPWQAGFDSLINNTVSRIGNKLFFGNGPGPYDPRLNGRLLENYKTKNFFEFSTHLRALENLRDWITFGRSPQLSMLGTYGENRQDALFALCSSLLLGEKCLLLYLERAGTHDWFPEFDAPIGRPLNEGAVGHFGQATPP